MSCLSGPVRLLDILAPEALVAQGPMCSCCKDLYPMCACTHQHTAWARVSELVSRALWASTLHRELVCRPCLSAEPPSGCCLDTPALLGT